MAELAAGIALHTGTYKYVLVDVLVLLLLLLLLLWRFGPFSGHDLPIAGVSTHLSFYEVRMT